MENEFINCFALGVLPDENIETFMDAYLQLKPNNNSINQNEELKKIYLNLRLEREAIKYLPENFSNETKENQTVILGAIKANFHFKMLESFDNICKTVQTLNSHSHLKTSIAEKVEELNNNENNWRELLINEIRELAQNMTQTKKCSVDYCSIVNYVLEIINNLNGIRNDDIEKLGLSLSILRKLCYQISHFQSTSEVEIKNIASLKEHLKNLCVFCASQIRFNQYMQQDLTVSALITYAKFKAQQYQQQEQQRKQSTPQDTKIPEKLDKPNEEPLPTLW
jgi:hypothetical protein